MRAGSDYVLLGSTEHGLMPIHRYSEEQAREAGLLADTTEPPGRARWAFTAQPARAAARSPKSGRTDPMRCRARPRALIERLREWTVRR